MTKRGIQPAEGIVAIREKGTSSNRGGRHHRRAFGAIVTSRVGDVIMPIHRRDNRLVSLSRNYFTAFLEGLEGNLARRQKAGRVLAGAISSR